MTDFIDKMAEAIATSMNGGEFNDGKWYSEGHRTAWRKAVKPYAHEIERLREALRGVIRVADRKTVEFDAAHAALNSKGETE